MTKGLFGLLLACPGAAHADTWHTGDLTTYIPNSWGGCAATCNPSFPDPGAVLLVASFNSVYARTGGVIVGSANRFTMVFTDATSALTSSRYSIADLGATVDEINASFGNGTPSAFAQEHLVAPASASSVPEPSSWMLLITAMLGLGLRRSLGQSR